MIVLEHQDDAMDEVLDEVLDEMLDAARAAWPEVDLPRGVFAAYLNRGPSGGAEAESALRRLRTNDLYLACACSRGDPQAIAAFERHCLATLDATLRKLAGVTPDVIADVKQQLRHNLLVGDGRPPRITEFSGRAELRHWLRVIAVREALAIVRRSRREIPSEQDALERAVLPALDLEHAYLKKLYQEEFRHAVPEALGALAVRDQVLLHQVFVDGLTVDELGRFHRVHRATAARWLSQAQVALSSEIRMILMRRLAVSSAELQSILRLLRSGLELSLRLVFPRRHKKRAS